jgi:signal transduction histidine kinase
MLGSMKAKVAKPEIAERIEDLPGTFEVASSPGYGTVLTISLAGSAAADGLR